MSLPAPAPTPSPTPAPGLLDITLATPGPVVHINITLPMLSRAVTVALATMGMVEAQIAALAGKPAALATGTATLTPIAAELLQLARSCMTSASNYQTCEANLLPPMEQAAAQLAQYVGQKALNLVENLANDVLSPGSVGVENRQQFTTTASATIGSIFEKLAMANGTGEILVETTPNGAVVPGGAAGRHFTIFLPGTQNWSPIRGKTVFDVTSDVQSLFGFTSAAEKGALDALNAAGFHAHSADTVTIAGYSEGAIVGKELAKTLGAHHVQGLIAVGAPIDGAHLPDGVKVINLQHNNDIVPQLDLTPEQDKPNWWNVPLANSGLFGHSLSSYVASVAALPAQAQQQLAAEVAGLSSRGEVVVTGFLANRG